MTPFGAKLRKLREERGLTQAQMAEDIGVSPAYLSALEHGKRGRPSWHLIQSLIAHLGVIWDEAEELVRLARVSHPKVTIDTSGLSPAATELANELAMKISKLDEESLVRLLHQLKPKQPI
ncbi:helix-turn-helix domain-containing protein [Aestuariivirga litoralis]|uniref:helix-turn-helix domain-containing protein n=1 Tax=Aestuariivirga litoralis TaxID=2650924 RepID=UPI0018C54C38|nr:helix-turn-helix transcriptional regulator [Aestuariivirga litoralis]MBG1233783.1 helix-turn-helix transcriptional regulator [Aestuariivirga litoralis]